MVDVFLGRRSVWLHDGTSKVSSRWDDLDPERAVEAVRDGWSSGRRSRGLRLWFSGDLCRPFVFEVPASLRSAAEVDLASQEVARATHAGMDAATPLRVWLEPARRDSRLRLGAALPEHVAACAEDRLLPLVGTRRLHMAPWWAQGLRTGLAQHPAAVAMALIDPDSLTLVGGRGPGIDWVHTTPVANQSEAAMRVVRRVMAGIGQSAQGVVQVCLQLTLDASDAAVAPLPKLDLVTDRTRSRLGFSRRAARPRFSWPCTVTVVP